MKNVKCKIEMQAQCVIQNMLIIKNLLRQPRKVAGDLRKQLKQGSSENPRREANRH